MGLGGERGPLSSCLTTVLSAMRRILVAAATRRRSTRTIVWESVGERETCAAGGGERVGWGRRCVELIVCT